MHGRSHARPSGGRNRYYICPNRECQLPYIRADELEADVWSRVKSWVRDPRHLEAELKKRLSLPPADSGELTTLEDAIAAAGQEEERLTALYIKGLIDPAKGEELLAQVRKRTGLLKARLAEILRRREATQIHDKERAALRELSSRYRRHLSTFTLPEKQTLIRMLVSGVELFPDRAEVHIRIPASLLSF